MTLLLQLSDPHFGTERAPVTAALRELVAQQQPQVLIVSGDVTQRASAGQFRAARSYIDALQIPAMLAVPGNHDIPLLRPLARWLRPYAAWHRAFGPDLEPVLDLPEVLVLGVNTTRPRRHKDGEVSAAQVQRVAQRLRAAAPRQLRIVVTHQPVHVVRPRDEHNMLRGAAAAARAWVEAGADLVLGGHIHFPSVGLLADRYPDLTRRAWGVQAGTAVSHRTRSEVDNSVNLLRHDAAGGRCTVERWDYRPHNRRFELARSSELELDRGA
ncbi:metallophosphoesterase [Solimonas sp. K1W22B-7]|uniref:metallophosphoesterase family protein n=1 Tax=Solimonas sp. K1W22B-7 TaxID=2303331 RepID=UPI000E32D457|nr:metallophosphoesterase [Solimonas sp. K1W22B-7]AXQ28674.1 metallophosphoesterase [Solimonas sp. K1W22B-7]